MLSRLHGGWMRLIFLLLALIIVNACFSTVAPNSPLPQSAAVEHPLFHAASNGDLEAIGSYFEEFGEDGLSAMLHGETALFAAARSGHVDAVRLLAQLGLDVNQCDSDGKSPLYTASQNGHAEVVRELVRLQADSYGRCKTGPPN
ncbi:membrane-associated protein, putative [Bodo saltans]|uniref:Membrane-associated protein, putative n=1 Tax=Bodo saltans TaxID=75058 RepID=A0A0S4IZD8_BODSA|nr:membrane-associated protein, putative [Bodo saltans]|eukprot:CUG65809.1 membrane-associated protein, putative [Bodo saltans]